MINRALAFIHNVKQHMDYQRRVRETIKELRQLSDGDLNDIGLSRGEIYHVAHETAEKPQYVTATRDVAEANENMKGFV